MEKHTVFVRRIEWGMLDIEAETFEEAKRKAYDAYIDGETSWGDEEAVFWNPDDVEPEYPDLQEV